MKNPFSLATIPIKLEGKTVGYIEYDRNRPRSTWLFVGLISWREDIAINRPRLAQAVERYFETKAVQ